MAKTTYEKILAIDNTEIRTATTMPGIPPIGVIQIIHGFGEGIIHYTDISQFFANHGYICVVHDQRGHGEMPELTQKQKIKAQGISPGYEYFLHDIKTVRTMINHKYKNLPVTLYGHSMGGNIAISYLLTYQQNQYKNVILESPWLRLYVPLSGITLTAIRLLGRISRNIVINTKLDKTHICRNEEKIQNLDSDGCYHNRISIRLIAEITEAGENAIANAGKITIPTLLLCPAGDKIVCPNAIREFAQNAKNNIKMMEYPDGYHALRHDSICDDVLRDISEFLGV